ncbi:coniferyl aldehyde dehydrogenase [Flocculibacter collagenilyticus]|uniref:coniferyl aldehyde dehydrogenase n=1 Tax=Flocculibacter collagenilyticus TaxID=2744479 RepID=UPI0018F32D78|nr:coniferyl aldehyde dehydrogenase [Flocculibacter collagenilyticus]
MHSSSQPSAHQPNNLINVDCVGSTLQQIFSQQKDAYNGHPYPSLEERINKLSALKNQLLEYKEQLAESVSKDFGHRSEYETYFLEVMTTIGDIKYTIKHLKKWMKPQSRKTHMLFQPGNNRIMYQPLGVVGVIVPWNYPIYLSLCPLITAIGAGNRVMIKMSEFTPHLNATLKVILARCFNENEVAIIEGEADVAAKFSSLPFDHILFTGSTTVGKHVMKAAAENLTPVTLELGGKSPTVIAPDMPVKEAAKRILFGKCVNAGQTCVAPDYILCPKDKIADLVTELKARFAKLYPDFDKTADVTHIVNDKQYSRLMEWLNEAKEKGADVISMSEKPVEDYENRRMPLQLVLNGTDDMQIMRDEIFGPILPILPYDNLDDAIAYIRARPRPLALYIMSFEKQHQQKLLKQTHSGGVTINDTLVHFAQEDLPAGGIGASGMGQYHGHEGFLTFSKARGIHSKGKFFSTQFVFPPYKKSMIDLVLKLFVRK